LSATEKLGEISSDISKRKLELATKSQRLAQTIVGLGIKDGSAGKLREAAVPSEKAVTRYKELLAAVDEEISAARTTQSHLNQGLDKLESRIATLKTGGVVASEEDLKSARGIRDDGWALVRGIYIEKQDGLDDKAKAYAPKGNLANVYAARVVEADKVADAILADLEETTELSLLERQKSEAVAKIAATVGEQSKMTERRSALIAEWRTLWPAEIVTAQLPNEMYEWLKLRQFALLEAENQTKEQSEISALERKESDAIKGLVAALRQFRTSQYRSFLLNDCRVSEIFATATWSSSEIKLRRSNSNHTLDSTRTAERTVNQDHGESIFRTIFLKRFHQRLRALACGIFSCRQPVKRCRRSGTIRDHKIVVL
jgi:hypothetical protein